MFGGPGSTNDSGSISSVLIILYVPTAIFSLYWWMDSEFFGFSGKSAFLTTLTITGLLTFPYLKLGVNLLRGVNNAGYSVKGQQVYYDSKRIAADAASFKRLAKYPDLGEQGLSEDYAVDRQTVYHEGVPIMGADPDSFRLARYGYHDWAFDENHVYLRAEPLANANPSRFIEVKEGFDYYHDEMRVWYVSTLLAEDIQLSTLKLVGAYLVVDDKIFYREELLSETAGKELEPLPRDVHLAKTHGTVFYYGKALEGGAPEDFEFLNDNWLWRLGDQLYQNGEKVDEFSYSDIKLIDDNWLITEDKVYFSAGEVRGADPHNFISLGSEYGRDKNHLYHGSEPVTISLPGVQPDQLRGLTETGCPMHDERNIYDTHFVNGVSQLRVAIEINGRSVQALDRFYFTVGKDVFYVGHGIRLVHGGDAASFEVLTNDPNASSDGADAKDRHSRYLHGEKITESEQ